MKISLTYTSTLLKLGLCLFVMIALFSCKDDEGMEPVTMEPETMEPDTSGPMEDVFEVATLRGSSQKGPYLIGSAITVFELEADLSPTGKSFAEEIDDNLGSFELNDLSLASSFVELRASGFYYNEVTGNNSEAQLNLSALVDLAEKDAININILTTLEKKRVEYLINSGSTFEAAKKQALGEVLRVFEIEDANIPEAALLNIAQSGAGNGILLAISAIIQGNNSVATVSELISKISNDIEEDGVLNDESVCNQLSTAGSFVNPQLIRQNLEEWYLASGTQVDIPDFETYLTEFVQNTPCKVESNITYPKEGFSGLNLLATENTVFEVGESYTMRAILEKGTNLIVRVQGNNWSMNIGQGDTGWIAGDWDGDREDINRARVFTSARTGSIDFKINLRQPYADGLHSEEIIFEMFENGSSVPTKTKVIKIQGVTSRPSAPYGLFLTPPSTTGPTENIMGRMFLFGFTQAIQLSTDNKYGLSVFLPSNFEVEVFVSGQNFTFLESAVNEGWIIEQIDASTNLWKLTASGRGYYEAEIDLIQNQGCIEMNIDVHVNGELFDSSAFTNQQNIYFSAPRDGDHGPNILFEGNVMESGEVSLASDVDFEPQNLTIVLTGTGWSIPTPIENMNWQIEDYNSSSNSQTFRGTIDEMYFETNNDLKLFIDSFNSSSPPEILVEAFVDIEECGLVLIESFNVRF